MSCAGQNPAKMISTVNNFEYLQIEIRLALMIVWSSMEDFTEERYDRYLVENWCPGGDSNSQGC